MKGPLLLIGNMGSGKTSVGKALSRQMSWESIDLDDAITARTGKSIQEIFSSEGESSFRALEHAVLGELIGRTDLIISCGGGIVEHADSRALLETIDTVVYLTAPPAVLAQRIGVPTGRPLLSSGNIESVLSELQSRREHLYRTVATLIIDTTNKSPEEVADEILHQVNKI